MTEQEAIEIARRVAREQGWTWIEPASARLVRGSSPAAWEVLSNSMGLGAKARIRIDADSGAVVDKGYIPR